ncbi:hypothetical protein NQ318_010116, partial [Aromia moschata]
MSYLTESLKIEILMMIGYGDRARTQCEVVRLFRETHPDLPPLNQGTISKIEAQYREMGHVRKVPSKRQAVVDDDTKLNLLLALEENPITSARQLARDSNLNHKTVLKILKYEKKRPYKMEAVQELLEDDPDRRYDSFVKNNESIVTTQREFRRHFRIGRHRVVPSRNTILKWVDNLRTKGQLNFKQPGATRTSRTPKNVER